jgi:hypothetical protein
MIRVRCPWCPWVIVTNDAGPLILALSDSHIRFHAQQTIADLESFLTEAAETED